jgi:hypothetical protein
MKKLLIAVTLLAACSKPAPAPAAPSPVPVDETVEAVEVALEEVVLSEAPTGEVVTLHVPGCLNCGEFFPVEDLTDTDN